MLTVGHEAPCRLAALACRTESPHHTGKEDIFRQVSGTSDASKTQLGLTRRTIRVRVDQCTWATSSFMEKTSLKSGSYGKMWIIQVNIWAWKIPRSALQASSVFIEPNMPNLGRADW